MRTYAKAPVPQQPERLAAFLDEELSRLEATLSAPKFIAPTLLNSWVNYGAGWAVAGFYMDGLGRVHLKGLVKSGTTTAGTTIFTLPKGYRPAESLVFVIVSNDLVGRVDVYPNGNVAIVVGSATWLSFNGISFAAEQ